VAQRRSPSAARGSPSPVIAGPTGLRLDYKYLHDRSNDGSRSFTDQVIAATVVALLRRAPRLAGSSPQSPRPLPSFRGILPVIPGRGQKPANPESIRRSKRVGAPPRRYLFHRGYGFRVRAARAPE
jgi:hypothetical protein